MLSGIVIRATATVRTNSMSSIFASGVSASMSPSTVPFTGTSALTGTLSGMARQRGERVDEADAVLARLAHPDDPAAAHVDPGAAHILQRIEPVGEGPRGDDLVVAFGRGVDIVVVVIEPRVGQPSRLPRRQHAERHAGLQPHRAHALDHLDDARACRGPWGCATPRPCRSAAIQRPSPAPPSAAPRARPSAWSP